MLRALRGAEDGEIAMSHVSGNRRGFQKEQTRSLMTNRSSVRVERGCARKRTIGNAMLVFNNGHCTMSCVVLDCSESGAKIRPADLTTLPENFEIRRTSQPPHMCEVVRRSANYLGIRYLASPVAAAVPQ